MNIIIEKANKKTIRNAIKLSKKSLMKVKGGKVLKLGIANSITMEDFNNTYVAITEKNRVVGAVMFRPLDSDDCDWFEVKKNTQGIEICKLCVSKKFRGCGVATAMLEFAKQNFKNCVFCADVLAKPLVNAASEKTLIKCGFKTFKQKEWYHKCWNATFTWTIFKYQRK